MVRRAPLTGLFRAVSRRLGGLALACAVLGVLVSGCIVERPTQARWDCTRDEDCDEGRVCVALAGGDRTCTETCTDTCNDDAICISLTRPLAAPVTVCAHPCQVAADGRETVPCSAGFHCARQSYPASSSGSVGGLCVPDATCQSSAECSEGRQCTSSFAEGMQNVPNMLCVPPPDARGQCPMGRVASMGPGGLGICLPTCAESVCPPTMTCYLERGRGFGIGENQSPCFIGFYGAPCELSTDCFVGQCLEVGGRRQCTEPCDAASLRSDCQNLAALAGPFGTHLSFRCDTETASTPTCVAEGGVGHLCRDSLDCRGGLECGAEGYCTSTCNSDSDCGNSRLPPLSNGWCRDRQCAPRLPDGTSCSADQECATGLCYTTILTSSVIQTCSQRRPAGNLCTRDEECRSGLICRATAPRICQNRP